MEPELISQQTNRDLIEDNVDFMTEHIQLSSFTGKLNISNQLAKFCDL